MFDGIQSDGNNKIVELDELTRFGLQKVPIDFFENEYLSEIKEQALVLCVDIRGFSNFLATNNDNEVFKLIRSFTSNLLSCINQFGYGCSYYKLLGDGALVIWDNATEESLQEAVNVYITYRDFLNEELFTNYKNLGFAGALVLEKIFKYEISAESSQLKYRDYVGYGINLACRLEGLALKDELIVNKSLAESGRIKAVVSRKSKHLELLANMKGIRSIDKTGVYYFRGLRKKYS